MRFHEGDRVAPGTVLLRIDPERYRLEAERAEATYEKALADAAPGRRPTCSGARQLAREQLVAAEELNRSRGETERLSAASRRRRKAACDIARAERARAEVRPPRAGVINTRTVETGQFVQARATCSPRSWT